VPGDASGKAIEFAFDQPVVLGSIALIPGYAKVDPCMQYDWCTINRIPKRVEMWLDDGVPVALQLAPECKWQTFALQGLTASKVSLEIVETYPPTDPNYQRDFTPISEVELWGYQP
jgi:hypothetical protein